MLLHVPNIKDLGPLVLDWKIFYMFSLNKPMYNIWPLGAIFGPRGLIWTNFVEVH